MKWIYWAKLYETKFQASCLKMRMEQDWWRREYDAPHFVEIFESRKGKYGVRFRWDV